MQLALVYGWRPAGTVPDDAESPATAVADMSAYEVLMAWDARCVTAADAAAFAGALERAVRGDGTERSAPAAPGGRLSYREVP
jgi:hypothetical protein